jgi:protein gp37
MHPDWARSIRDQCKAAGVPFFFKQWGEWGVGATREWPAHIDATGKAELYETSTVWGARAFLIASSSQSKTIRLLERFGKKAAGRLLDGAEHNAMPSSDLISRAGGE